MFSGFQNCISCCENSTGQEVSVVFGHHETHGAEVTVQNCRSYGVNFVIWVTKPGRIGMSRHIHVTGEGFLSLM